jgi:hypothetical protein
MFSSRPLSLTLSRKGRGDILFFILLLATPLAVAAETWLDVNLASYHWDRAAVAEQDFNEFNPGIGFETQVVDENGDDYIAMAGIYRNSIRRPAVYALLGDKPFQSGRFAAGWVIGGLTGGARGTVPVAGFLVSYQAGDVGANVIVTPTMGEAYGFAGLQMRFRF